VVEAMLDRLVPDMRGTLGSRLVGLYLMGSALTYDFDPDVSDLDLVAVLSADLGGADLVGPGSVHRRFVERHRDWEGRLEVVYVSTDTLRSFRIRPGALAVISPGEPLHILEPDPDWLIHWYLLRTTGRSLYGPSPRTLIPPITRSEFIESVKHHALGWHVWSGAANHLGSQAYAILTMCRALHLCRTGRQASKRQAALWAQAQMPEWSTLMADALWWRRETSELDGRRTLARTRAFLASVAERIAREE